MTPRRAVLAALLFLLMMLPATPAAADSPSAGGDVTVAQTLGDRDLTFILRRVTSVPGPLRVDVITHVGTAPGSLTLAVTSALSGTPSSAATVVLGARPGSYGVTLRISGAGAWELSAGDGTRTARVPFVVTGPATSPPERAVYGGFLAAGLLLLVTIVVAVRARRLWWAALPGAGMVAGIAVAVTGAILSASLPLPPRPGLQTDVTAQNIADPYAQGKPLIADWSRPPAVLTVAYRPGSGDIGLALTDASTGLPADDLVVHDDALIHLMVVGPSGRLWHVHPIRTGPGAYEVHLPLPEAGHYAVAAEVERRGGGVQMLRSATGIDVAGGADGVDAATPVTPGRPAGTTLDGVPISISAPSVSAGTAVTLTVTAGTTATLQPWLGMLGHLIVVGPMTGAGGAQTAPVWAHAHSMGDLTPAPGMAGMTGMTGTGEMSGMAGLMPVDGDSAADETVAAYGPTISFTYTFALPGRYRAWIQVERDYRVLTVPVLLDVPS